MLTTLLAFSTYCLVFGRDEGKNEGQAELILKDPLYLVDLMDAALSSKHGNDYDAIKCIDGWTNNMCHSGNNGDNWLKVMFSNPAKVEKVQIFSRKAKEVSSKRIAGAMISLLNEDEEVKRCENLKYENLMSLPSQSYLINCGSDDLADTVKIKQPTAESLNLMEVFVLAKTSPQRALYCRVSTYQPSYIICKMAAEGLAVGDVITALVHYEYGQRLLIYLRHANDNIPCYLKYEKDKGWSSNNRNNGTWGARTDPSGSILPDQILLAIKITITAEAYSFTVNGEALPQFPHRQNFQPTEEVLFVTNTADITTSATLYSMTLSPRECWDEKQGDYRGTIATTSSGLICQRWDSQSPHRHTNNPADNPNSGLEENYCRTGEMAKAWCYTTDPNTRREFCDIPRCPSLPPKGMS